MGFYCLMQEVANFGGSLCGGRFVWPISTLGCKGLDSCVFIFDISDKSVFVVSLVGNNLGTAIGKSYTIFT